MGVLYAIFHIDKHAIWVYNKGVKSERERKLNHSIRPWLK